MGDAGAEVDFDTGFNLTGTIGNARMNKCVSAADAVSVIESGMTIGIGGWGTHRYR